MSKIPEFKLRPADLKKLSFRDGVFKRATEVNRSSTIPAVLKFWTETGRIDAIKLQWKEGMPKRPHHFWDSDVAKWMEAAAYSLATHPDKKLEAKLDEIIGLYAKSQAEDGYINSYFRGVAPEERFKNLRDNHELYTAGHLFEAAAVHYATTGKRTLLDPILRFAELLRKTFGKEPGKRRGTCGHEEVELALVKLYQATGERKLLELAKYFVDERGTEPNCLAPVPGSHTATWSSSYYQADKPARELTEPAGHAVRAGYFYTGMADVAAETGDAELHKACLKLWEAMTQRKMYVTGGIGSCKYGETFTDAYDLPNDEAYSETCAAIALFLFSERMNRIEPDGRYGDVMERALYNTIMSGVSLDGEAFFYANRLECNPARLKYEQGHHSFPAQRQKGFACSCCPPNVARLFGSLGQYAYSVSEKAVYANLYGDSVFTASVGGSELTLEQRTKYPYGGKIEFKVSAKKDVVFDLVLRIPAWASKWSVEVNGKALKGAKAAKGLLKISRKWSDGDRAVLKLEMPAVAVEAHPAVKHDCGKAAIMRGPIVYCLEEADNGKDLNDLELDLSKPFKVKPGEDLFAGMPLIEASAFRRDRKSWKGALYKQAGSSKERRVKAIAIPHFMWANRGEGEMCVWARAKS